MAQNARQLDVSIRAENEGFLRLLIIHGTADDNVYFLHSLKMTEALFRAGKKFEFLPLAGFTHMVPDPDVTIRLNSRIAAFFKQHLGAPSVASEE